MNLALCLRQSFSRLAQGVAALAPTPRPYRQWRGFAADAEALQGDWRKVGGDMQRVIDKVKAETSSPE